MTIIEQGPNFSNDVLTVGRFRAGLSERDRSLLARKFWTSNPEQLPNILPRVPAGDEIPDIEYRYDLTPPKGQSRPFVRCAHCFRAIHWRGMVALYQNGVRVLLGYDCGEKQFGFRWNSREASFSERIARHDLLTQLDNLEAALPLLHKFLLELQQHPVFENYNALRHELNDKMPEFIAHLTKAFQVSGGQLAVTERVRDIAAELARDERQKYSKNPETKPIFKNISKSLGRIAGASFFLTRGVTAAEARQLLGTYKRLESQFLLMGSNATSEGVALLESFSGLVLEVDLLLERLNSANRFFELANLQAIVQWLRKRMELSSYTASSAALIRLGAVNAVRIERRHIALPVWSSRNQVGKLLAI